MTELMIKDVFKDKKDATAFLAQLRVELMNLTGEEVSELHVSMLVDLFFKKAGPLLYNRGVDDAVVFLIERFEMLADDASLLKKSDRIAS